MFDKAGKPHTGQVEHADFTYDLFKLGWNAERHEESQLKLKEGSFFETRTRFIDIPDSKYVSKEEAKSLLKSIGAGSQSAKSVLFFLNRLQSIVPNKQSYIVVGPALLFV